MTIRFNVLVGCESGVVKGIDTVNHGIYVLHKPAETYADTVNCLEWSVKDQQPDYLQAYIATKQNRLLRFNLTSESIDNLGTLSRTSPLKGFAYLGEDRFVSCSENGVFSIDRLQDESFVTEIEGNAGPVIFRMRLNPFNRSVFGTGGKENDLKIWSLDALTQTDPSAAKIAPIFQAKNVRPNEFRLRMPVWVTDLQFIDERNRCLVVTGHHQIRLYDPQSSARRPVHDLEFEQCPIMSLALLHSSQHQHFLVGNTQGEMAQFDIRRLGSKNIVHKYKGVMGSIRSIDTHPTEPLIATASIDQFLRIYHAETYRQVSKFYLKSRLTSVLFAPHEIANQQEQEEQVAEKVDEDLRNDEVWSQFKRKLPKDSRETSSSKITPKKKKRTANVLNE